MRERNDRRLEMLERGLNAFDVAQRARRAWRRAMRGLLVAVAVGTGIVLGRGGRTPAVGLPEYVQIIGDDPQLAAELTLANACERFERSEGRLVVVECALPGTASPSW